MTMGFDPGPDGHAHLYGWNDYEEAMDDGPGVDTRYVPVSRVLEDGRKECAGENCQQAAKQDYWNNIKSQNKGWFFQKNGLAWCPDHTPDWVEGWRKKRSGSW